MSKGYCPILPKDLPQEEIEKAFPWQASPACQDWTSLESKGGEQLVLDNSWSELINSAGQNTYYYIYGYKPQRAEKLFGEDLLAEYLEPFEIKMYVEIQDVPKSLSQYGGFFSDDTITAYVHIKTFERLTQDNPYFIENNIRYEPKPHDLIQLISYGCDRPGDRAANYYEITNKEDQLISGQLNPMYSHSIWKIKAKRFMFSHQAGAIEPMGEDGNDQLFDNKIEGVIPNNASISDLDSNKKYDFDIDKVSKEKVFDQSIKNQDSIYGGYYN